MTTTTTKVLFVAGLLALALTSAGCGPATPPAQPDAGLVCDPGFLDCDGVHGNGCETDVTTVWNCGGCGTVCGSDNGSAACVAGSCTITCATGYADCDQDKSNGCETNLTTPENCGTCGVRCSAPHAVGACVNGMCELTCAGGYGDCNQDFADGCESDLASPMSCGSCDNGCTAGCNGGMCEICDATAPLDSNDPLDAARAMGLCAGVIAAEWVLPDGSSAPGSAAFHLGHGNLTGFGPTITPREGQKLLALSSGTARQPSDPGYQSPGGYDKGYTANHPAGFPKESPACPGVTTGTPHDAIALQVTLEVPPWANGFAFDFNFYTFEWPSWICSQYNDFFVAIMNPIPPGQPDGNISFDAMGNPISVNNAFLTVCGPPGTYGGKLFTCPDGTTELQGTGFESHAATSWLTTKAPAEPGSMITLTFGVYDSGDGVLDSTTLIDNFRWLPVPPEVGTEPVP